MRLMHALGGMGHDNGVCDAAAEAGFAAVNGRSVGPDLDEESTPERCDLVLWGSDARRTSPHLMPRLKALATAGVPVFVIDVYRTETLTAVESWEGMGSSSTLVATVPPRWGSPCAPSSGRPTSTS